MSRPAFLNNATEAFSGFWNARNERERKQLVLALFVVVLGLVYSLLIDPAYSGRAQLQKSLPTLRLQAAELQALSKDAAALASVTPPPVQEMTRESMEAALTRRGLKAQSVAVTGNLAKVQLSSVSFAGTLDWLDEMQKTFRASVVDANIVSLPQPDTVNVTLTLRQQKNEQ